LRVRAVWRYGGGSLFVSGNKPSNVKGNTVSSASLLVNLRQRSGVGRESKLVFVAGFVVLLLVLAGELVQVARATSAAWDEPHHLYDGYTVWKTGDYGLNPEVPPLVKLAAALPLLREPQTLPVRQGRPIPNEAFLGAREFVFGNGGDRVLLPARLTCAGFTLALALLLGLAAWEIFGRAAGLVTLAFFVFDPNVLANGAMVTTDLASALFLFATIYAWYHYCKLGEWKSWRGWALLALTGVIAGLALAAKFTGILALPMLLLLALGEGWLRRSGREVARLLAGWVAIGAISLLVLWSFYGFRYAARPGGQALKPTLAEHVRQLEKPADARHLLLLARGHILPEGYLWGLADTKIVAEESPSYFFGRVYWHGDRWYFPGAFVIKSTLPFLLLLVLLLIAIAWGRWRPYRELLFLTLPVVVYCYVAINSDMNIGMRHLMPIYGFLYVLAAGGAVFLAGRDRRWVGAIAVLLVWQIATTVRVAPNYMAYANEAWGGPSQTHRYLSDANVDWGQQLKQVKRYLDQRGIKNCWFAYFPDGAIDPIDYGIPCKRLPTADTLWWEHIPPPEVPDAIDGPVLISDGDLEGIEFGSGVLNPYDSFRRMRPTTVLDYGVYVYDGHFEVPLASGLVHAQKAEDLLGADQVDAAAREAGLAVGLAPQSVQVQAAVGDVLAREGKKDEALVHYRAALVAATTVLPGLQEDSVGPLRRKIRGIEGR
jgi:4-amino-4-deoxy-L-arabinose transferase-like glycosyltransferase